MARKVFFSFHFERDAWRVGQVRNSQLITNSYHQTQFLDGAHWEQIRRQGYNAIKNWIDGQLYGTSCTIVLIGYQTSEREWVKYEIEKSWERGNGIIGIYIHNMRNSRGETDLQGHNPFHNASLRDKYGNNYYPRTYNWLTDNGRMNVSAWIEQAIRDRL